MPDFKYTTTGKKVVIIGSLNSQEKIVQEIFVIDGSEVPSGEHFVVKSLHDAPAVSWEEKRSKEIKDAYERDKIEYKRRTEQLDKQWKELKGKLKTKIEWAGELLNKVAPEHFQLLVDYITGEINWIVKSGYTPELIPIDKFQEADEDGELRLISVFGCSKGDITYAQGRYGDFSGGYHTIYPFNNYEDALEKFKEEVLAKNISDSTLEICKKYGFDYPEDKKREYFKAKAISLEKSIEKTQKEISSWQQSLSEYKALFPETDSL